MARQESDREDLMREATALRERAEFAVPGESESVIAGYRSDGRLSIYFGPDPCYHFDAENRLRRAFIDDRLYRTQGHTLARLNRVRTADAVELRRHDLTPTELPALIATIADRLRLLLATFDNETAQCLQTVPEGIDLGQSLARSLTAILAQDVPLAPRMT